MHLLIYCVCVVKATWARKDSFKTKLDPVTTRLGYSTNGNAPAVQPYTLQAIAAASLQLQQVHQQHQFQQLQLQQAQVPPQQHSNYLASMISPITMDCRHLTNAPSTASQVDANTRISTIRNLIQPAPTESILNPTSVATAGLQEDMKSLRADIAIPLLHHPSETLSNPSTAKLPYYPAITSDVPSYVAEPELQSTLTNFLQPTQTEARASIDINTGLHNQLVTPQPPLSKTALTTALSLLPLGCTGITTPTKIPMSSSKMSDALQLISPTCERAAMS